MYLTKVIRAVMLRIRHSRFQKRAVYLCTLMLLPAFLALGSLLDITFVSKNVSFQIPAEITFDLDLSKIESDNIYIRKSKDDLEGFKINKAQKEWKTVYPYPGYYKAQLIVDNTLVKVNDVFVKSSGWVGTLDKGGNIQYLGKKDLNCDAMIGLSEHKLKEIHDSEEIPTLTFHYFDQINPVSGLDFTLETRLRNTYNSYASPCRKVKIEVVGTSSTFLIPLSLNACSAEEPALIAGQEYYPSQFELKNLQADYSQWQEIKLEVSGGLAKLYVSGEHRLNLPIRASIGQIVGLRYHFEGSGEVDKVMLSDTRDIIYAAPF